MRNCALVCLALSVFARVLPGAEKDELWRDLISKGERAFVEKRIGDALRLLEQSSQIAGLDAGQVAFSHHELAMCHHALGDFRGAKALYARALEQWDRAQGAPPELLAATYTRLGDLLTDTHEFAGAVNAHRTAMGLWKKANAAPVLLASSISRLANANDLNGDTEAAETQLQEAIAIQRSARESDPLELALSLDTLARIYSARRDFQSALPVLGESMKIVERTLGVNDPRYAVELQNLAILHRRSGNNARAEPLLRKAAAIYESSGMPQRHPYLIMVWNEQGLLALEENKLASALLVFQKAYDLAAAVFGPNHLRSAFALSNLALAHARSGKLETARGMMERVLAIEKASPDVAPLELARTLTNCGDLFTKLRQPEESEAYYKEAIPIWRSISKRYPGDLVSALRGYARILKARHNPNAGRIEQEAKTLLETSRR